LTWFRYQKGREKQAVDYLWAPFLEKICKNNAVQQERVNGNTNMNAFVEKRARVEVLPEEGVAASVVGAPDIVAKVATMSLAETVPPPPAPKRVPLKNADIRSMFSGKKI